MTTIKLSEHFVQLKKFLTINQQPDFEADKVESLNKAIVKLQEDLTAQKIINEAITKENLRQKKELENLQKEHKELDQKVNKIMTTLFQSTFHDTVESSMQTIDGRKKKR